MQNSTKILLCVSLEGEPGSAPRLHCCFLTAPPLSLHPLPSLISNCSNLPFGTQGRSWRLKPISCNQEKWHTKTFVPRSPRSLSRRCQSMREKPGLLTGSGLALQGFSWNPTHSPSPTLKGSFKWRGGDRRGVQGCCWWGPQGPHLVSVPNPTFPAHSLQSFLSGSSCPLVLNAHDSSGRCL